MGSKQKRIGGKKSKVQKRDDLPGNATILTSKLIKDFCAEIKLGCPADLVCDYLGISTTAFWAWVRKGNKFLEGAGEPRKYRRYGRFVKRFKRALAVYRRRKILDLERSEGGDWIKPMAILERRDRKTFSRKEQMGGADEQFQPDEKFL